jgi:hypothetical protein
MVSQVARRTKPSHIIRLGVVFMVRVALLFPTQRTGLTLHFPRDDGVLNQLMSAPLLWIAALPFHLAWRPIP